jgi:hypothetical protein
MVSETHEAGAKAALLNHLRTTRSLKGSVVISELAMNGWARRADIVTVNGEIVAYEIKTAADRLTRLRAQIEEYSRICDRVVAVIATKHLNTAMSLLPEYVGVKEITRFRGRADITEIRVAGISPNVSLEATISFLPVNELARLVRSELGKVSDRVRASLEREVAGIPPSTIREHMRRFLIKRHSASTNLLATSAAGRRIVASDLEGLRIWTTPRADPAIDSPLSTTMSEWLTSMAVNRAFGEVPQDIQDLLSSASHPPTVHL